jgi:hypothetical protein
VSALAHARLCLLACATLLAACTEPTRLDPPARFGSAGFTIETPDGPRHFATGEAAFHVYERVAGRFSLLVREKHLPTGPPRRVEGWFEAERSPHYETLPRPVTRPTRGAAEPLPPRHRRGRFRVPARTDRRTAPGYA